MEPVPNTQPKRAQDWNLADVAGVLDQAMAVEDRIDNLIGAGLVSDGNGPCPEELYAFVTDELQAGCGKSPYAWRHDCRPGCSSCCHQSVPVMPVEALAISAQIEQAPDQARSAHFRDRLWENAESYRMGREYIPEEVQNPGFRQISTILD